jgi:hypothetical protein
VTTEEGDATTNQQSVERSIRTIRGLTDGAGELHFPERGSSDKTTMTRKKEFRAWVGRPDRLTRISNEVEVALRRAFDDWKPKIEAKPEFLRQTMVEKFAPETRVQGGALERRGDLASILSDMDAREIKWVKLGNGSSSGRGDDVPSVSVTIGREPRYKSLGGGVSVEVTGSDKQWVAATYDSLINELAKGVPWWSRLIADSAIWVYMLLFAPVVYAISRIGQPKTVDLPTSVGIGVIDGIIATALSFGSFFIARRLLPDFELLEPGGSSKARKAGTFLVALIGLVSGLVTIWAFVRH